MTAAAFLKRALRAAIRDCGGIERAARALGKAPSTVGRWHSRNDADLPNLHDALVIDEIALIERGAAPVLRAMALELGHVCFALPEATGAREDDLALALAGEAERFGRIAGAITEALRDARISPREAETIAARIDAALEGLVAMRALARRIGGIDHGEE